jgi:hypothetical protein
MDSNSSSISNLESLADRLAKIPKIVELSDAGHNEAWVLADALLDIASACEAYLKAFPQLLDPKVEGQSLMVAIIGLTIECQHLLYHLEDPRFLRELFDPLKEEWAHQRSGDQNRK